MGKYINHTPEGPLKHFDKDKDLIKAGATLLPGVPNKWEEDLICVVDSGYFQAAAYVQDERDLNEFSDYIEDERPRVWLKWDRAKEFAK
jgi:hypothetical protein